jgi:hypothetical protein
MAAREVRRQSDAAEDYGVPVMENPVYSSGLIGFNPVGSEGKVLAAAAAYHIDISVHHHVERWCLPENLSRASHVIRVGLTIQKNPCVFP